MMPMRSRRRRYRHAVLRLLQRAAVAFGDTARRVQLPLAQMLRQQARFHSEPTLTVIRGRADDEAAPVPRSDSTRDRRFDQFKTFSGRLERQFSTLCGRPAQEHMTNGEGALLWQNPHTRDHLDKHRKNKSVDARESKTNRDEHKNTGFWCRATSCSFSGFFYLIYSPTITCITN